MFALSIAAVAGFAVPDAPLPDRPLLSYRLAAPDPAAPVDRATPAIDSLFAAGRSERRGRRKAFHVAGVSLAIEAGRTRRRRGPGTAMDGSPAGLRLFGARQVKEMSLAVSADWAVEGRWRVSGGLDRVRLADATLTGGRTGASTLGAAVDYAAAGGLTLGGGWRATTGGRHGDDRLASFAAGAPPKASGGFVRAGWARDRVAFRVEAAAMRIDDADAILLGGPGTDRRVAVSVRREFY